MQLQQAKEAALDALRAAEAAQRAAESANKLKSQFLANVSHDIRTPLNAVLGFAEILKDRLGDVPQNQTYLNGIMEGGRTLLHLIDDILDLSRIEVGQLEIHPESVNLFTVFTEIQQMFASKAQEKGIQLTTQISPTTPETVLLDGTRLRQILTNLVGNAVKFTKQGKVELRIANCELRIDQSDIQNLKFEIEDTGIGIPQDDLERMFEPFQQHDPRSPGGTGLGLAITKRLVELMAGTMTVESAVNKGTLVKVLLPVTGGAASEKHGHSRKSGRQIHFHGATVLLVEDDAPNREVVRAFTATCDLRLIEAENGQEALQILKPENAGTLLSPRPDLILMDIRMPIMDGYEATQIIKADPELRTIPVVALTAYATKEQVEHYQDLYDDYLTKPISKRKLLTTLTRFLPHTQASTQKTAQESLLEELNTYAAQTSPFPQAFLDTLRFELLPKHKETSELMSVDDIRAFAEVVIAVADTFTIPPLKSYGEDVLRSVDVFDVTNMKRLLAVFPEIVEIFSQ